VAEADIVPEIVPIWLIGLESVLPNHRPYIPRVGAVSDIDMSIIMDQQSVRGTRLPRRQSHEVLTPQNETVPLHSL